MRTDDVRYYIIYPGGRQKIEPTPQDDAAAEQAFLDHWTAHKTYVCKPVRKLIKETRECLSSS